MERREVSSLLRNLKRQFPVLSLSLPFPDGSERRERTKEVLRRYDWDLIADSFEQALFVLVKGDT